MEGRDETSLYGLVGSIEATPGNGPQLAKILAGMSDMPGCRSYIVAMDSVEPDLLWVTEVWESRDAHEASLQLESVQSAIGEGRSLIAGFRSRHETRPLGGIGLSHP